MPSKKRLSNQEELYALRRDLCLSQVELGLLLQVGGKYPGQMISRYERGAITLPARVLNAARLLKTVIDKESEDDAAYERVFTRSAEEQRGSPPL